MGTVSSPDSLLIVTEAYFSKDSTEDNTFVFPSMYNYGKKKTILSFTFFKTIFLVFVWSFWFLHFKCVHNILLRDCIVINNNFSLRICIRLFQRLVTLIGVVARTSPGAQPPSSPLASAWLYKIFMRICFTNYVLWAGRHAYCLLVLANVDASTHAAAEATKTPDDLRAICSARHAS